MNGASILGVGTLDSVAGGADDQAVFARAAQAGAEAVEVTVDRRRLRSGDGPAALAAIAAGSGLPISSLVLDHLNLGGLGAADPVVAADAARDVELAIDWAGGFGAGVILVPFFAAAALSGEDDVDRAAAALRDLCPRAEQAGVVLCYEGPLPARRINALAERVASPAFGVYFDVANPLLHALDPPTELRAIGPLVRQVHFKDVWARKNDSHLGRGRVPLAECVAALGEIGFRGWVVLETPAAPPPVVARDVARARRACGLPAPAPRFGALTDGFRADWDGMAAAFRAAGLTAVQLSGEPLAHLVRRPEDTPEAVAALAEAGVAVEALGAYRNLVHPDEAVQRANCAFVGRCLELAPLLGTHVVATETGTLNPEADWLPDPANWSEPTWSRLENATSGLLAVAEAAGTVLAVEHHPANVARTPTQLLRLLGRFPSEHLQLVCDPYNLYSLELLPAQSRLTPEYLDLLEDRFVLAHAKDVGIGDEATTRPRYGAGVFEQAPYLRFLRAQRPDLAVILEHLAFEEVPAVRHQIESALAAAEPTT